MCNPELPGKNNARVKAKGYRDRIVKFLRDKESSVPAGVAKVMFRKIT